MEKSNVRYGMCINDGEQIRGTRGEIEAAVAASLLATDYTLKDPTARQKAAFVLDLADGMAEKGLTQGLDLHQPDLDRDQELLVWRERGGEKKNRDYLIRVGRKSIPYRTDDLTVVKAYVTALMVGDGVGVDRAAHLGDHVAVTLSEGGAYAGHEIAVLKDGRDVRVWWEGEE